MTDYAGILQQTASYAYGTHYNYEDKYDSYSYSNDYSNGNELLYSADYAYNGEIYYSADYAAYTQDY